MAEVWGKRTGICQGMGGSMHVADLSKGILGANGIVGGGLAIATGAAFGAQLDGDGRVVVSFFGDGAANQGVLMETLNVSTLWGLPLVFVCEHNQFSEFTPAAQVTAGEIADRARAFGMPSAVVDGNDVVAVWRAAGEAVSRPRSGGGDPRSSRRQPTGSGDTSRRRRCSSAAAATGRRTRSSSGGDATHSRALPPTSPPPPR